MVVFSVRMFARVSIPAVLGLAAMILPFLFFHDAEYNLGFWHLMTEAYEKLGLANLISLFLVGGILGLVINYSPWLLGVATMSTYIIRLLVEVLLNIGAHNLFPIELFFYLLLALLAGAGSFLTRKLKEVGCKHFF